MPPTSQKIQPGDQVIWGHSVLEVLEADDKTVVLKTGPNTCKIVLLHSVQKVEMLKINANPRKTISAAETLDGHLYVDMQGQLLVRVGKQDNKVIFQRMATASVAAGSTMIKGGTKLYEVEVDLTWRYKQP